MKNFNFKVFYYSSVLFLVLSFFSLICDYAKSEGTLPDNIFYQIMANLSYVFFFPYYLFEIYIIFEGIFINSIIYGVLIERIYKLIKMKMSKSVDSRNNE